MATQKKNSLSKSSPSLQVEPRQLLGRQVKQLRRAGQLPANIYGKKVKSTPITIDTIAFDKVYRQVGETTLINLQFKNRQSPQPVLITNVQLDPVSDHPLHVDFHQVDLTEKVTADIPIKLIGEAPVVKDKDGVLVTVLNEVEVEALPTDLPDHFEVDLSSLADFGDAIHVKDLQIPPKVTVKVGGDEVIITIQERKEAEVVTPPPVEAAPAAEAAPAEAEEKAPEGEEKKPKKSQEAAKKPEGKKED